MLNFTGNRKIIIKNKSKKTIKKKTQSRKNKKGKKTKHKKQFNLGCPGGSWNCFLFVSFLYIFPRKKTFKKQKPHIHKKNRAAGAP